jgi:transposase InsO family protein
VIGLKRMSKSKKPNIENLTREELIEIIKIQEGVIRERIGNVSKEDIKKHKCDAHISIATLINFFGVANSSYYYQKKYDDCHSKNHKVIQLIYKIYKDSRGAYGYRRIAKELKLTYQLVVNHKRVQKLMRYLKIRSVIKTKNRRKDPKNMRVNITNKIGKDFRSNIPMEKLYTDVTYIKTPYVAGGYLYLSAVIDGFDFSVLAPTISRRNDTILVMDTFNKMNLKHSIIHSDHGIQYSSDLFLKYVAEHECLSSMSAPGNSLQNRPIEFF